MTKQRTYIIAEAGVNHNGDLQRAHDLIDAAVEAGADAVKFQTFIPELLTSNIAKKADYQQRNQPNDDNQLQMLQKLALDFKDHHALKDHCDDKKIDFLSSPFDEQSARFLIEEMSLPELKLGSGELTNGPLLWQLALSGRRLILSTGMATLAEVREALGLLCLGIKNPAKSPDSSDFASHFDSALLLDRVRILHCTTEYPCPIESVNLSAMDTLAKEFGLPCGYSDHTEGIAISLAAVARGACIIEKHFTLDQSLEGPDHLASLEPMALKAMIRGIREIEQGLGDGNKSPATHEMANAKIARKSIIALQSIAQGESFTESNITCKRPGNGISPMQYWSLLNNKSNRDYAKDELIQDN